MTQRAQRLAEKGIFVVCGAEGMVPDMDIEPELRTQRVCHGLPNFLGARRGFYEVYTMAIRLDFTGQKEQPGRRGQIVHQEDMRSPQLRSFAV